MIRNLEMINHDHLREDIITLRDCIIDLIFKSGWDDVLNSKRVTDLIYLHVLGVGHPICVRDGGCWVDNIGGHTFYKVEVTVDYNITSGYNPYQELDKPIHLSFTIGKGDLREKQLEKLGI